MKRMKSAKAIKTGLCSFDKLILWSGAVVSLVNGIFSSSIY